jgi:hypothetical protein
MQGMSKEGEQLTEFVFGTSGERAIDLLTSD